MTQARHPGWFSAICDRCKQYKSDCLIVPYRVPPRLTPIETEPVIGLDYIGEREIIDPEDIRIPTAVMCDDCFQKREETHE
jgi:hypothetical protein